VQWSNRNWKIRGVKTNESRGKVTSSFLVPKLADQKIEEMVETKIFSNRSNAVENSVLLMHFVLQAEVILPKAVALGIETLLVRRRS
jgi:Arc/MetJ-type ribon-helix-helix transcriptional regulator